MLTKLELTLLSRLIANVRREVVQSKLIKINSPAI